MRRPEQNGRSGRETRLESKEIADEGEQNEKKEAERTTVIHQLIARQQMA